MTSFLMAFLILLQKKGRNIYKLLRDQKNNIVFEPFEEEKNGLNKINLLNVTACVNNNR